MALANRMTRIQPSPTAVVSQKVRALKSAGRDVINLGEGELDFDTPAHVRAAAVRAIEAGETRYTAVGGTDALKAAIQAKFARENGLDYAHDQLVAAAGAKQIIFCAFAATLDSGDEVVTPVPSWVSYPDIAALFGGRAVRVDCPAGQGFKLTPEALEAALTPRTRWLVLNNPNNPTGAVYSPEELAALGAVLARWPDVMILSDEIYEHCLYDARVAAFASAAPQLANRTLTVSGMSKTYSMTGWRLGFAGGPAWLIGAIDTLLSQSTTNASSVSQAAAVAALEGGLAFFEPRLAALRDRRDRLLAALAETGGALTAQVPEGAFYVYANCAGMIGATRPDGRAIASDIDAAEYLLDAAGVASVPGSAFAFSPYLRFAYGVDDALLDAAGTRLVAACAALRGLRP